MELTVKEIAWVLHRLKQIDSLVSYSSNDLNELIERMKKRTYALRDRIIKQGDIGEFFFIIYKGQVAISVRTDKTPKLIASLATGDYFGEMSLITDRPCIATVTAISDTEVFLLPHDDLRFMLMQNPALVKSMSKVVRERRAELYQEAGIKPDDHDDFLEKLRKYFNIT